MKNILFGLNTDNTNEIQLKVQIKYEQLFDENFEFKSEFYLLGIKNELKKKNYDVLILNELIDPNKYIELDEIDKLRDESEVRIIYIVDESRENLNEHMKSLFALGVMDAIYSEDLDLGTLANLIHCGRSRKDAKLYYDLDSDINYNLKSLKIIEEEELKRVLKSFEETEGKEEISSLFNLAVETYNNDQILFLISHLDNVSKSKLKDDELFKEHYKNFEDAIKDNVEKIVVEKEVIVEVEKEILKEIVVEKEIIKEVPKDIADYKKVIGVIGGNCVGTTTIIEEVAKKFSEKKKVAILDMSKNKNLYDKYIHSSETNSNQSITNLINNGIIEGFKINKNLDLYSSCESKDFNNEITELNNIIAKLKTEYSIVLIDLDFEITDLKMIDDVYCVISQDLTKLKDINRYLCTFEQEGFSKFSLIVNKFISEDNAFSIYDVKECLGIIINYSDPNESYSYHDFRKMTAYKLCFDENIIKNSISNTNQFQISNEFIRDIENISSSMYMLNTNESNKSNGLLSLVKKLIKK